MTDTSDATTSKSREAFDALLATLAEAADRYAGAEWGLQSPDDVAGGLRVLAHLLEGGLVGHFEDDPAQPVFRQIVTSTRKAMGDNADAIYFDASVSSRSRLMLSSSARPSPRRTASTFCFVHKHAKRTSISRCERSPASPES